MLRLLCFNFKWRLTYCLEDDLRNVGPVDAQVYLEEMSWNEDDHSFYLSCRCGGKYSVSKDEAEELKELLRRLMWEEHLSPGGGGCSELRSCHCTPAWATEQDHVKKKKKKLKEDFECSHYKEIKNT
ncbi:dnaJ homolog subfamily C member 24 isoform X6 [Hylobates moloch]|uniref:dnaJ homolog subfamily C member 24 isoform X6 n=1 Tax=Hylobates moloch TaxID=81572 RepID=UPI002675E5B7|nr:dnaJ homolog subfamily C member 24 isoform X6 [Hylobates moloch]